MSVDAEMSVSANSSDIALQDLPADHPLLQRAQLKIEAQLKEKLLLLQEGLREQQYALKESPYN